MREPKHCHCECCSCMTAASYQCGPDVTYDRATKLWLCDRCWFHTDPKVHARADEEG